MIKKMLLLFCCLNVFAAAPVFADTIFFNVLNSANSFVQGVVEANKHTKPTFNDSVSSVNDGVFIHPYVSERVIESFFGHIIEDNTFPLVKEFGGKGFFAGKTFAIDDNLILKIVQDKWYSCMTQAPIAFVPSDCIINICDTVFKFIPDEVWTEDLQKSATSYCGRFAAALMVSTEDMPNKNCQYKVTKESGNQNRIKFERPDGSGYMNKTYYKNGKQIGTLAWRLNNPGNLRDAPARLACAVLQIKQPLVKDGVKVLDDEGNVVYGDFPFAVFDEPETGWLALKRLLGTEKYTGKTIFAAMQTYAPSSDNNRPDVYAKHVKQALVERGQHAGDVDYYETVLVGQLAPEDITVMMEAIKAEERTSEGEVIEF